MDRRTCIQLLLSAGCLVISLVLDMYSPYAKQLIGHEKIKLWVQYDF